MRAKIMLVLAAAMAALVMSGPSVVWAASYTGGPGASYAMDQMSQDRSMFLAAGTAFSF